MTGNELIALLDYLSPNQLDFHLYVIYRGEAIPLTAENILVQLDEPVLRSAAFLADDGSHQQT